MEQDKVSDKEQEISVNSMPKGRVQTVLAHSYSFYFIMFLLGFFIDSFLKFNYSLGNTNLMFLGMLIIVFSSILVFWAQRASKNFKKENLTKDSFCHGPYRFSRNPTHWGLSFLMLGFGILTNSIFVIISAALYFFIAKILFLKKEEKILEEKYGTAYLEYKKSVKF